MPLPVGQTCVRVRGDLPLGGGGACMDDGRASLPSRPVPDSWLLEASKATGHARRERAMFLSCGHRRAQLFLSQHFLLEASKAMPPRRSSRGARLLHLHASSRPALSLSQF